METQAQITITFSDRGRAPTVEIVGQIPRRGMTMVPRALRNAVLSHESALRKARKAQMAERERVRELEKAKTETVDSAIVEEVNVKALFDNAMPEPTGPMNHLEGIAPEFKTEIEDDNATLNLEDEDILDEQDGQEGIDGTPERP